MRSSTTPLSAIACRAAAIALIACSASTSLATEFRYTGDEGPGFWAQLDTDWAACDGERLEAVQSPVNIAWVQRDRSLRRLELHSVPTEIDVFNNGHTIEQRYEETGSFVRFEGVDYELRQFHFHALSEHTVRGKPYGMEMHAVFAGPEGTLLVIGQFFELGFERDAFLQRLINAGLPRKEGDEVTSEGLIDLKAGLRDLGSYYTYQGSLTTPPCSEIVTWVVLKRAASMSPAQYEGFRSILGNNFRPTQHRNGRQIRSTLSGPDRP